MKRLHYYLLAFSIVLILGLFGAYTYARTLLSPVNPLETDTVRVVVPKGAGVQRIASILEDKELIRNQLVFRAYVQAKGMETSLQAGSFELSPAMSSAEIAMNLTEGTEDVWITILEGWRKEEIAEYLSSQEDLELFDSEEFISLAASSEGKLYPETYLIPRDSTASFIHSLLVNTFEKQVVNELESEIETSERDFEDVLIMASLIEREARDYEQMRHVSGILWNRIDIGMALQVDATLQYAKGYDVSAESWWNTPYAIDKSVQSPYNTYQNAGLPPTPIANPSISAIKAALDPLDVNDLFYLHAAGNMYYADTIEGHNANVTKYLR